MRRQDKNRERKEKEKWVGNFSSKQRHLCHHVCADAGANGPLGVNPSPATHQWMITGTSGNFSSLGFICKLKTVTPFTSQGDCQG